MTPWHDRSLRVASDTLHRAQYRLLQSWYREVHLRVGPGYNGRQYVGSLLPQEAASRGLNFLTPEVHAYVRRRVPQIQAEGGTVDATRLQTNLLSSQPLCCNVFGHLSRRLAAAAPVLSTTFGTRVDEVTRIVVEWAPDPDAHLGDRTAFDAFVEYRAGGQPWFLGIEVKYTEPFSQRPYDRPEYRRVTRDCGLFVDDAADRLREPATNQLWRQVLLTASLTRAEGYAGGHAAVLTLEGDGGAAKAVAGLTAELRSAAGRPLVGSLERLVTAAAEQPALGEWAEALRTRYLDLAPVRSPFSG